MSSSLTGAAPASKPGRVLVVDDEPDILTVIRVSLERVGCEVVTAGNGLEALADIFGCSYEDMKTRVGSIDTLQPERRPDVVITDIWMPEGMGGYEFMACLQRSPTLSDLPVIVLTGTAKRRTDMMQAYEMGAIDFLTKPFKNEEIVAIVRRLIGEARAVPT
jgi:CheY-like chemotaxis protein